MTSRRQFVTSIGVAAMGSALPLSRLAKVLAASSAISVLTDEISQDFAHACEVASKEIGLGLGELRAMGNKNIMNWDANDVAEVRKVLDRFKLKVSEIATPIFKTDWPGAPKSPFSPKKPEFGADFSFAQQDELLDKAVDLAKTFNTQYIRVFDFWRLDDQKPHRQAIDDRIRQAAIRVAKKGVTLTLENELRRLRGESLPYGQPSPFNEMRLLEVEGLLVRQAMERFQGNVSRAARALGLSRSALYRSLERHKI